MKILTSNQTGEVDRYTIENEPIDSIELMERASYKAWRWISRNYPNQNFAVFVGPGNNGGDALAIARMLIKDGREVITCLYRTEKLSPDAAQNLQRLKNTSASTIIDLSTHPLPEDMPENTVAIDGLFGSGLNRPLNEKASKIVTFINNHFSQIIAVDVPSGLFCEDNSDNNRKNIIRATFTLSFQMPKLAFLFAENQGQVGQWVLLPIGLSSKKIKATATPWRIVEPSEINEMMPVTPKFAHKGTMGHALLIAGSYGKTGAALLASKACLRSGVGLLTTHVPHSAVSILQTAIPEAMMSVDRSDLMFTEFPSLDAFAAIGIGPGLGTQVNSHRALKDLLPAAHNKKLVIDADGLNILSSDPEMLDHLPQETVLTPHPKEFERLTGPVKDDYHRLQVAIDFAKKHKVVLVLKGAYTAVISSNGEVSFNTTGNPGMATAGSGDTLTGIILALLANGIRSFDAARIAVYVHGLAGDFASADGQRGTIATDIIKNLGPAFAHAT
ncbi:NAD(P)H-hydrate dehydratase [Marinilabilia rubra]|uniref:Bifunctional NAD(P)H-hydrate repair enzyme n=1 Tax=Marinilabilia rubra TaxID=2162893 RepID=A0A2U2B468_9BACT|nr:NAD(P)H-hydrate dehydratase [Marinilabilia rubra]PWD97834.1 bifunctional ADP-dependent NAD(P)H-hydrate dehydratase/NAD(P)H-hydrate epimerase [Marinilabilia rubra]